MASFRSMLAFAVLTLAGCGGAGEVNVSGRILKDGQPLIVVKEAYVTLSFVPGAGSDGKEPDQGKLTSYPAKFDYATGSYSVRMPAGNYKTMFVFAPPPDPRNPGKLNASKPIVSEKTHELKSDKTLDIDIPK